MDDEKVNIYLEKLGKKIRDKRIEAGFTQEKMSEIIDSIDYKYYQKIENGKVNITIKTLLKICEHLEIEPEIMFSQQDDHSKD